MLMLYSLLGVVKRESSQPDASTAEAAGGAGDDDTEGPERRLLQPESLVNSLAEKPMQAGGSDLSSREAGFRHMHSLT